MPILHDHFVDLSSSSLSVNKLSRDTWSLDVDSTLLLLVVQLNLFFILPFRTSFKWCWVKILFHASDFGIILQMVQNLASKRQSCVFLKFLDYLLNLLVFLVFHLIEILIVSHHFFQVALSFIGWRGEIWKVKFTNALILFFDHLWSYGWVWPMSWR